MFQFYGSDSKAVAPSWPMLDTEKPSLRHIMGDNPRPGRFAFPPPSLSMPSAARLGGVQDGQCQHKAIQCDFDDIWVGTFALVLSLIIDHIWVATLTIWAGTLTVFLVLIIDDIWVCTLDIWVGTLG